MTGTYPECNYATWNSNDLPVGYCVSIQGHAQMVQLECSSDGNTIALKLYPENDNDCSETGTALNETIVGGKCDKPKCAVMLKKVCSFLISLSLSYGIPLFASS